MNEQLIRQIDALLDGELDNEGAAALSALLRDDAEARRYYLHQLDQHAAMLWRTRDRVPVAVSATRPMLSRRRSIGVALALAAAVALVVTAWFVYQPEPDMPSADPTVIRQPVAMLSNFSADAVFTRAPVPMTLGAELEPGAITLAAGSAQVMFKSGAMVDLVSPCEFSMTGVNSGRLDSGHLAAHVPPAAAGFTVLAPHGVRIMDLGTRFDLVVSEGGRHLETWVIEGTVQIESAPLGQRVLTRGQSLSLVDGAAVPQLLAGVSSTSRRAYPILRHGFVEGVRAYTDRDYIWVGLDDPALPAELHGADYIQSPNDDKDNRTLSVTLNLTGPATVWVLWNPNAPQPDWLVEGFESTPQHISLAIPNNAERAPEVRVLDYSLWRRRVDSAGELTLGSRQVPDKPSPAGMYGIIVTTPETTLHQPAEKLNSRRSK